MTVVAAVAALVATTLPAAAAQRPAAGLQVSCTVTGTSANGARIHTTDRTELVQFFGVNPLNGAGIRDEGFQTLAGPASTGVNRRSPVVQVGLDTSYRSTIVAPGVKMPVLDTRTDGGPPVVFLGIGPSPATQTRLDRLRSTDPQRARQLEAQLWELGGPVPTIFYGSLAQEPVSFSLALPEIYRGRAVATPDQRDLPALSMP
ncbi:hypothetical protein [Serinicoccus kebangsaanensis]|uniref:hypothetical protein n=1 Tax=Serinicoccus kebangsaanensis TaxID=2602069 RepID=UPI00124DC504|nr:hypothetical protein [Serinicoccus kebangsaanensis]